jgi:hypothetical protein
LVLKFPRLIQITILAVVTQVLIIGYELQVHLFSFPLKSPKANRLQVRRLGEKVATSNGQPYYPIYTLAPYRLATVAAGSLISYFWTIFPNPITDRSQIRKDLGKALYLLANLYSCVHTTIELWVHGNEGDIDDKNSPGKRLEKLRHKIFGKEMLLLMGLRQHSDFTKFEPTIGGSCTYPIPSRPPTQRPRHPNSSVIPVPKKVYDDIIQSTQNIVQYMALIAYATRSISPASSAHILAHPSPIPEDPLNANPPETSQQSQWLRDLSALTSKIDVTSHSITTLLSLLSNSVSNGQALPPYLEPPKPYNLVEKLEELDREILSMRHVEQPEYSAFAVMEVASNMISDDLDRLLK